MCDTALPLALPLPYTATANTALLEHPGSRKRVLHQELTAVRQNEKCTWFLHAVE